MQQLTASTNGSKRRENKQSKPLDLISGKVPPHAKDLEKAILGAIMLDKSALDIVQEVLSPECFYVQSHQLIFSAMLKMASKSIQIDLMTVVQELISAGQLDEVGGPYYITTLQNDVVSSAHLETHCRIVLQKFMQRELIRVGMESISLGYDETKDVFDAIDEVETEMMGITARHLRKDFTTMSSGMVEVLTKIEQLRGQDSALTGITSGLRCIDKVTHGWQPTDLIILAARPSVGKTAFALNLVRNAAMSRIKPVPVGIFSLEMSALQLNQRMLAAESAVPLSLIKIGQLDDDQLQRVNNAAARLAEAPIFVDDNAALNIFELRAKARRMANKHGVKLIVIDYLQLMSGEKGSFNREQEISKISRELKKLAKDLDIPIIALSQMSREVEKRADKEPQLSDLRESGAIEQDADMIMFLYRPSPKDVLQDADLRGKGMAKIAKHRNGSLADFVLGFKDYLQLWHELDGLDSSVDWKPLPVRNTRLQPDLYTEEENPF